MKFVILLSLSQVLFAAEQIQIKVTSVENVKGNGAIEVCGTAIHAEGTQPLLVTVKHDESYYTTLTAPGNQWCTLIKRWTFNGKIDVSAVPLK